MATTQTALGYASGTNQFTETAIGASALTVRSASTQVYLIKIDNTANGAASYLRLYNNAGAVTLGTTVPDDILFVPASATATQFFLSSGQGKTYGTAVQVACTTAGGTTSTSAPASAVRVDIIYSS